MQALLKFAKQMLNSGTGRIVAGLWKQSLLYDLLWVAA
jgi:hypothetical protein